MFPLTPVLPIVTNAFVPETVRPPEILVAPFKDSFPVPVLKVPVPVCVKFPPEIVLVLPMSTIPPLTELKIKLLVPPDAVSTVELF